MNMKFTEGRHTGEYLASEARGTRSREQIVVAAGVNLAVGAVLGMITASGKYTELDLAAGDGSEVAAGILYDAVDATAADQDGVAHVRDCEVVSASLEWPSGITPAEQAQAESELRAAGIIPR